MKFRGEPDALRPLPWGYHEAMGAEAGNIGLVLRRDRPGRWVLSLSNSCDQRVNQDLIGGAPLLERLALAVLAPVLLVQAQPCEFLWLLGVLLSAGGYAYYRTASRCARGSTLRAVSSGGTSSQEQTCAASKPPCFV